MQALYKSIKSFHMSTKIFSKAMKVSCKLIVFCILVGFFSINSLALAKVDKADEKIKISTQVNDQVSVIVLQKSDKEYFIEDASAHPKPNRHSISKENYDYLIREFKKLKDAPKIPQECYRSTVEIEYFKNEKLSSRKRSCVYLKTLTSESYENFLLKAQILR